jgi:hypothetical protein
MNILLNFALYKPSEDSRSRSRSRIRLPFRYKNQTEQFHLYSSVDVVKFNRIKIGTVYYFVNTCAFLHQPSDKRNVFSTFQHTQYCRRIVHISDLEKVRILYLYKLYSYLHMAYEVFKITR